jgi:hypothetical protein
MGKMNAMDLARFEDEWQQFEMDRLRQEGRVELAKELMADVDQFLRNEPSNHYLQWMQKTLTHLIDASARADIG